MSRYNTEQRKKLITYFENSNHKTISAQELFLELSSSGISMSAIYRNLAELESQGVICKVLEKNRKDALYQYINPKSCVGIIHLKCSDCEETIHLDKNISQMLFNISMDNHLFKINESGAFLYGECLKCQTVKSIL